MTVGRQFGSTISSVVVGELGDTGRPARMRSVRGRGPASRCGSAPALGATAARTSSSVQAGRRRLGRVESVGRGAATRRARRRPASSAPRSAWPARGRPRRPSSASRSIAPNRSVESRPTKATSPPRRPMVRAVLKGPPPATAVRRRSGRRMRSIEGLARDDDHARAGTLAAWRRWVRSHTAAATPTRPDRTPPMPIATAGPKPEAMAPISSPPTGAELAKIVV